MQYLSKWVNINFNILNPNINLLYQNLFISPPKNAHGRNDPRL